MIVSIGVCMSVFCLACAYRFCFGLAACACFHLVSSSSEQPFRCIRAVSASGRAPGTLMASEAAARAKSPLGTGCVACASRLGFFATVGGGVGDVSPKKVSPGAEGMRASKKTPKCDSKVVVNKRE